MNRIIAILLGISASTFHPLESSELEKLGFLLGRWEGAGGGAPGQGNGGTTFATSLQNRIMTRTNHAEYPATSERPALVHDDFMVIYAEAGAIRADYYDSEGHVIRYVVDAGDAGRATFVSEPVKGQPRYRLSYKLEAHGEVSGTFEVAPPGASDAFERYLSWSMRKTEPAAESRHH